MVPVHLPSQSMKPFVPTAFLLSHSWFAAASVRCEGAAHPGKGGRGRHVRGGRRHRRQPGELQYWVERDHLDRVYPLPCRVSRGAHERRRRDGGAHRPGNGARRRNDHGTGTRSALRLQPCLLDHRGHRRRKPGRVSLGSAAWARWVVDGDLGYEIDAREIPPTGRPAICLCARTPFEPPAAPLDGQVYALNAGLATGHLI